MLDIHNQNVCIMPAAALQVFSWSDMWQVFSSKIDPQSCGSSDMWQASSSCATVVLATKSGGKYFVLVEDEQPARTSKPSTCTSPMSSTSPPSVSPVDGVEASRHMCAHTSSLLSFSPL